MFTFTALLLPLALAVYYIKSENKSSLLLIITGVITGALISACKAFLSFSHRIIPYSFIENFVFFLLNEIVFPMMILYIVFLLISRDTIDFKIKSYFPLVASFYSVFLPYIITTSPQGKSIFSIFIKPLLFLSMLYTISLCLKTIFKADETEKKSPKRIIVFSFIIIAYILLPAIIESIWIINLSSVLWILLTTIYLLAPIVILELSCRTK